MKRSALATKALNDKLSADGDEHANYFAKFIMYKRTVRASFYSKLTKLIVVHVDVRTESVDEKTKIDFCTRLQDVLDRKNAPDMLIITEYMNVKFGDQNWDYKELWEDTD